MYEFNEEYQKLNNYIDKCLFYRKQNDCIDIDVCKYNIFIYGVCYENISITSSSIIFKQKGEKYELLLDSLKDNISFRGDTAINYMSILMQIANYQNSSIISKKQINKIDEKLKISHLVKDVELANLLEKHAMLCYSVGNFYPIPFKKFTRGRFSLNTAKGRCVLKGYNNNFDDDMFIFLEDIYMFFVENKKTRDSVGERIKAVYEDYMNTFGSGIEGWNNFIDSYYLRSFVDKNNYPIQFWKVTEKGIKSDLKNYLETVNLAIENRTVSIMKKINLVKNNNVIEKLIP